MTNLFLTLSIIYFYKNTFLHRRAKQVSIKHETCEQEIISLKFSQILICLFAHNSQPVNSERSKLIILFRINGNNLLYLKIPKMKKQKSSL